MLKNRSSDFFYKAKGNKHFVFVSNQFWGVADQHVFMTKIK